MNPNSFFGQECTYLLQHHVVTQFFIKFDADEKNASPFAPGPVLPGTLFPDC